MRIATAYHCGKFSSHLMCLFLHMRQPLRDLVWLLRGGPPPGPAMFGMTGKMRTTGTSTQIQQSKHSGKTCFDSSAGRYVDAKGSMFEEITSEEDADPGRSFVFSWTIECPNASRQTASTEVYGLSRIRMKTFVRCRGIQSHNSIRLAEGSGQVRSGCRCDVR